VSSSSAPATVHSTIVGPPTISDRQISRTDRWQPPSSTDCSGPRLQQSRVCRQQQT
jgi:hypothetical protein